MAPASYQSSCLRELADRGYIHQCTDLQAIDQRMAQGPVVAYSGFDPTADSLHVGHLLPIMLLRVLQKHGHTPIALMGGATALIGDPTGKDKSRPVMTEATIQENIASIQPIFARYLRFGTQPGDALLVNNQDWLSPLSYMGFLSEFGRHFTINRMLTLDSVRTRLEREQPMTFLEFNYMILQAYDFQFLAGAHNCVLQVAGSDQWGNIINGIDLTRRVRGQDVYGLTAPLLETSDGKKMGKTAGGAVWLNEARLSHFDFWQYWRNVPDDQVVKLLKLFTEIPLSAIEKMSALEGAELNEAKRILADTVTGLARGVEALESVHQAVAHVFADQSTGTGAAHLPAVSVDVRAGLSILDAYIAAGFANSRGEARRLIEGGGARVDDAPLTDLNRILTPADFTQGRIKLSAGKKRHIALEIQS